jgi:hypothetical protein
MENCAFWKEEKEMRSWADLNMGSAFPLYRGLKRQAGYLSFPASL